MANYLKLSKEIEQQILSDREKHKGNPYAFSNDDAVRRSGKNGNIYGVIRPAFVKDIERIINVPYYNRYSDKTQVLSFYANDDITRRGTHVQQVSRVARDIGYALNLNLDLIEAISLGHDIGHTPFGHAGERILSELYEKNCGKYFNHNINSARVLDTVFPVDLSLQTLDGIICHNGEMVQQEYTPVSYSDFVTLDERINNCTTHSPKDKEFGIKTLVPATLEGCVMRLSDIIAYLGKDRQDAIRLGIIKDDNAVFADYGMGTFNAEIINNISVDIIEHSYGKPYISMSENCYNALKLGKDDNYKAIYQNEKISIVEDNLTVLFEQLYDRLKSDYLAGKEDAEIFTHHINYIVECSKHYAPEGRRYDQRLSEMSADDVVVDFISAMTDDYFIDICRHYGFEISESLKYVGYFDNI